jgi:cell division septal protein FtsQ
VWASLLKGKTAVIQEVAEEMQRRDPSGSKTRVALTDGERALQLRVEDKLGVTLSWKLRGKQIGRYIAVSGQLPDSRCAS